MNPNISIINNIVLFEDVMRDVELTLGAREEHHLANLIKMVNNGAEALDYFYRCGNFNHRTDGKGSSP